MAATTRRLQYRLVVLESGLGLESPDLKSIFAGLGLGLGNMEYL